MTNSTTKVYDEALQERVRKYMKDTGLSQNKLAPRIGMSGASLSNYMNCKMDGSVEGLSLIHICMVDMAKDGESADRLVYRTENYRAL